MYHCRLHIYLVGPPCRAFDQIQALPPLERFTHVFHENQFPDGPGAGLVLVNLAGAQPQALPGDRWEQIALAGAEQAEGIERYLPVLHDYWVMPMSETEIRFRFEKWQRHYKGRTDAWQDRHYLEAVLECTPNLVWFKDRDGVHERVNESFCQTVNKTKAQVQGQRHAYIWDVEQDDPACIESERIVMETRRTLISEEAVRTGEGERLLTTYKSPLYDLDGSVMGTVGVAVDVTRERDYAAEIVRKNHTLETIFTTVECGIMSHSIDGTRILGVNRAALEILGYASEEEMIGDGFQMIAASVVEEDKPLLRGAIEGLRDEGDSINVEYRVQHKDGQILHVMGNIKLIRENGELVYQRFLLDCTSRKLEEEKNKRRQMELVHALGIDYRLICFFDLDSGEGQALRTTGCPYGVLDEIFSGPLRLEECMNRYAENCVYPEDRESLLKAFSAEWLRQELSEKGLFYINYRTLCQDKTRYFQVRAVRAGTWEGEHGVVLGFRSVDEEIKSEMEKQNLLRDALMQANRASKAKSMFLSNMSHDIRTPMNAIIGFTTLAITHLDQKELVEEYLKKIMTSGSHLLSLINDVLDMSRIESGKIHLDEGCCSLPEILHGLRSIVQTEVHAKQLELFMDAVDVWHEEIYCDKLRLNQVLLNLLGNSIKYTTAGGVVSMRVLEKPSAQEGYAYYEFRVKDTGVGMSQEFISHIFEPFERERNSTINGIQGTGLGMAITKNIVDMMNGSISVESEQGVGTEFTVSFTFRLASGEREPAAIPALKNCRALVVDDDFNTCDSVSYMLQQIGLRAEWTLSGREAVLRTHQAAMRGDHYEVYVIDWMLPDMNGVEVTRRIRKEVGEDAPIIVMTSYDWTDIEAEANQAGVTAFCSKPLFLSELRQCLNTIIERSGAKDAEKQKPSERLRSGRILLTEDNELNQEIAEAILTEAGFTVDIAGDGKTALRMLQSAEPDYYRLVLADIQMPVMNGYEMAKAIRGLGDQRLANIPIIAMTANAFEEDRQAALQSGMNGHIAKPINIQVLFDTLDEVLS